MAPRRRNDDSAEREYSPPRARSFPQVGGRRESTAAAWTYVANVVITRGSSSSDSECATGERPAHTGYIYGRRHLKKTSMTIQIRSAVAYGQTNHPEDVALVQLLINGTIFGEVPVSAVFDGPTGAAVEAFQRHHFGFTDRVLSPADIGFLRLRGGPPFPDPTQSFHNDMILKTMALHFAGLGLALLGDVPFASLRTTADGQGDGR